MINQLYPHELQLNKANTSDTEVPFLDLHLSVSNGLFSSKHYDTRDYFDFDIVKGIGLQIISLISEESGWRD